MIGWIIGVIGAVVVANKISEKNDEINYLRYENNYLRVTVYNLSTVLKDYDYVNKYAKTIGFRGAVDFFYYLAEHHDNRFSHFARFLNKVRHIRNDIAHNGSIYEFDNNFLNKLNICKKITLYFNSLPSGVRFRLE